MWMVVIGILLVIIVGALYLAANYLFKVALTRNVNREAVFDADHNQIEAPANLDEAALSAFKTRWLNRMQVTPVEITNHADLLLKGWTYERPARLTHQWAILCHGFNGRHEEMYDKAPFFDQLGFNILLPDMQSHGQSEGQYIQMGYGDRLDIQQWIAFILQQDPEAQIVLYGISMGGAAVMMTAGEVLPAAVQAIIEDCGYTSVADEFRYQLKQLYHVPAFPLLNIFGMLVKHRLGWRLSAASSIASLHQAKVPMLFFHGGADTFVPASMLAENFAAAPVPKAEMLVPGAQHGMAALTAGDAYWEKVHQFLTANTSLHLIKWQDWNGGEPNGN